MPGPFRKFSIEVDSPVSGIQIGFATNEEGYMIAVVPRYWFRNPDAPSLGVLDDSKILVVPGKSKTERKRKLYREFISLNNIQPSKRFNSSNKKEGVTKTWAKVANSEDIIEVPEEKIHESQERDSVRMHALLNLLLKHKFKDNKSSKYDGFDLISNSKEFKVILFKSVIEMVEQDMRELRGIYRQQLTHTSTIKGQIDFSASSKYLDSGMPKLVCRTNVFDLKAPHYSALMTAFDYISSTANSKDSFLKELAASFSKEARIQRARFREIPSFDRGRAIQTLKNTPIPPQLQKWRSIFKFALVILENKGSHLKHGRYESNEINYLCSDLWEDIIEEILKHSKTDEWNFSKHPKVFDPWKKRNSPGQTKDEELKKEPDFRISKEDYDIILDAKYYDTDPEKVFRSNQYQFFAYALMRLEGKRAGPRSLVFAFPHAMNSHVDKVKKYRDDFDYTLQFPFTILEEYEASPVLHPLSIEFPSPEFYIDPAARKKYIEEIGKEMDEVVEDYFSQISDRPNP